VPARIPTDIGRQQLQVNHRSPARWDRVGQPEPGPADYIRSSADTSNLSNDSGWQYFIVVK